MLKKLITRQVVLVNKSVGGLWRTTNQPCDRKHNISTATFHGKIDFLTHKTFQDDFVMSHFKYSI